MTAWRAAPVLLATFTLALPVPHLARAADEAPPAYPAGAAFFQANCAVCHGPHGAGQPALAPPLTTNPARYATDPEGRRQLAMTVLYGMFGGITVGKDHYDFKMPDFARFTDEELATVLNFVVFDLAHAASGTAPLAPTDIAAERKQPIDGAAVRKHRSTVVAALGL